MARTGYLAALCGFELKILLLDIVYRHDSYGLVKIMRAIAPNGICESNNRLSACCMAFGWPAP
ncbi:hypothetical protein H6G93_30105 [Nostoc sp. FACHB-973]|uniref:Uncharacterized protein n=1 Tax=Desmonostoc muscorum LEGE 12446 TaxID=1828758 RepID=A0A8J7AFN3_DESMC|nr:hypothetical protein [Desmonostoc muscorum]MBD2519139.1 hypothetical protein [Nostoc sp. FACHB-973]MCF2147233.1 hypothetical protein [Desmonostoc muscorum LEGE 12446]